MIRIAGLITIGCLACVLGVHPRIMPGAIQASPRQTIPDATPVVVGPFEVPGVVPVSLLIQNGGKEDRLLGGSSPVAASVAVHATRLTDGRRLMMAAPTGIVIPEGETLILEPATSHLMLLGLTTDLVQGETFPLTLQFERAGEATVTVRVRRRVDAAGVAPIPPVAAGDLTLSLASAPPAPTARCSIDSQR